MLFQMFGVISANFVFQIFVMIFWVNNLGYQCYFIIGLQDRYGIGDSIGGAQLTMEEVWIVQTGNFTLNGLVLLLFCNFFGKVKVVLEPQDMLADLIRVLAFA